MNASGFGQPQNQLKQIRWGKRGKTRTGALNNNWAKIRMVKRKYIKSIDKLTGVAYKYGNGNQKKKNHKFMYMYKAREQEREKRIMTSPQTKQLLCVHTGYGIHATRGIGKLESTYHY